MASFLNKLLHFGAKPTEEAFPQQLTTEQLRAISLSAILQMNASDRCNTRLYPLKYINRGIAAYELQVKRWGVDSADTLHETLQVVIDDQLITVERTPIKLPLAWRVGNVVDIVRFGFAAEYVTEAQAWELVMPMVQKAQEQYASWDEYAADFLQGADQWWTQGGRVDAGLAARFKAEDTKAVQWLLDSGNTQSPWHQVPLR